VKGIFCNPICTIFVLLSWCIGLATIEQD